MPLCGRPSRSETTATAMAISTPPVAKPGDELPDHTVDTAHYVKDYLSTLAGLLAAVDPVQISHVVDLLESAYRDGRRVLLCGNGGSASTASHLVCDLSKNILLDGGKPFAE